MIDGISNWFGFGNNNNNQPTFNGVRDENGTPWVPNRLEQSVRKHANQHGGRTNYLAEVRDVWDAIIKNHLNMDINIANRRGSVSYGGHAQGRGNLLYRVKVGRAGRTMVVDGGAWHPVVHYAKQG